MMANDLKMSEAHVASYHVATSKLGEINLSTKVRFGSFWRQQSVYCLYEFAMITGNLETQFLPREAALKEALVSANFSPATRESNT